MASYFQENEARPIVSAWIEQGFEIDRGFILEAIEADEQALSQDVTLSAVAAFGSIASGCLMLALAGFSAPMLIPVGVVVGAGLVAWNSDCAKGDRELEGRFLREYPQTFDRISQRVSAGEGVATIAAEYGQMFRAYRKSDRAALAQLTATSSAETLAQSDIQNSDASNEPRTESVTLAPTELQAIAPGVAPSMVHSKILCPIEVLGRDPYQSMGLIGGQRTGKTYTAALHTQNVKRKLGAKIIYINLMDANGDAADDWSHADVCVTCHLRKLPPNKAKATIEHVTAVVNDFFNGVNQILVFDEWVGFTSKANQWPKKASQDAAAAAIESKEAKAYIEPEGLGTSAIELMNLVMAVTGELTQSGKKQAKAIWLLSPMVKAGSMEPQGLVIKEVAPMVVAISKDESVSWTHPVTGLTQEIGFDDAGYRASIPNMGLPPIESIPKMDCVRMLYAKGTWYSLDNLPKLEQMPDTRSPSQPIAQRKAEIDRMKANIARLQESNDEAHDERISAGFDYEMHDSFTPPRERLERSWDAPAVDVESTAIDERPDDLDSFPLVLTIWEYLDGKDARSMKQIRDAMRKTERITEDTLREKLPNVEGYAEALKAVITFGVGRGFLKEVSEDCYEAVRKH